MNRKLKETEDSGETGKGSDVYVPARSCGIASCRKLVVDELKKLPNKCVIRENKLY